MTRNFPEPKCSGGKVKLELDLSNYVKKANLKNLTGLNILKCPKNVNLASLQSDVDELDIGKQKNVPSYLSNLKREVDKLDVDKLIPFPVDLIKLGDLVRNDVVQNVVYNAKIKNTEDKRLDITNLATDTTFDAKTNEVKVCYQYMLK